MANRKKTCPCGTKYTPHRSGQTHCGHCFHSVAQLAWESCVRMASRRKERALHEAWERLNAHAAARSTRRA